MGSKRGRKKKGQKSQNGSKTKTTKSENLENDDWTKCLECSISVKTKNLSSHLDRIHPDLSKIERKKIIKDTKGARSKRDRRARKGRMDKEYIQKKRRKEDIIFISVLIIIFVSAISGYFYYENYLRTGDSNNGDSVINGNNPPPINPPPDNTPPEDNSWLDSYSPEHKVGSGNDDWWIKYPSKYSDISGQTLNHPEWVRTALNNKMILIFAHSTSCDPCKKQEQDANKVLKNFGSDVTYYDLITDSGKNGDKIQDVYSVYYDPENPNAIPLTVAITKVKDSTGKVTIGWHSYVGALGEDILSGWIKDGIYYYEQNG